MVGFELEGHFLGYFLELVEEVFGLFGEYVGDDEH